ncbi:rho guanine nucleotide exchange factor 37 isoform X3 [Hypanus sabinus]|uniref:rho guanine nucleotide exchange factor 37 isoform X3 n=1 Tax=Hypanus sabinus TaxID=79690 RepID=UPI0028C45CBA|nr:rho guanine nucleotide exchange factor 37 isoform X3 [Hypanus sabinus]
MDNFIFSIVYSICLIFSLSLSLCNPSVMVGSMKSTFQFTVRSCSRFSGFPQFLWRQLVFVQVDFINSFRIQPLAAGLFLSKPLSVSLPFTFLPGALPCLCLEPCLVLPVSGTSSCLELPLHVHAFASVFLTFKQELEDAYKVYCVNYDNILLLESMYKKNEHIWKEIMETLTAVRSDTGAMTLTFYLVMPVQRIFKYQLLLESMLKNTPQSDEGYAALEKAINAMQEVNININEYKGLREVANKYIKAETLSIKDSICRINTHSIAKKASRLSQVIKHEAGILPKTTDKDYDDLVMLFNLIQKDVTTLKKNTGNYITNVEHFQCLNPYQDFPDLVDENDAACYRPFIEKLYKQVIPEFKRRMEAIIYEPLCALASLFSGPQQLLRKHKDKMLDYEKVQEKIKQEGGASYDEKAVEKTYEILHSLLLSELPRFNRIVLQLQAQILQTIIYVHYDLANNILELISQHLHEFPSSHKVNFWQQAEETLQKSDVKLEEFCQIFESILEQLIEQPVNQEKLASLLKKYGPSKIYLVTSNISGNKGLDLTLQRGDLVAVLQSADTKGKTNRWLVDSGVCCSTTVLVIGYHYRSHPPILPELTSHAGTGMFLTHQGMRLLATEAVYQGAATVTCKQLLGATYES